MRHTAGLLWVGLVVGALAVGPQPPAAPPGELTLLLTGNANGFLQTCGCGGTAVTGLAQAATLVRQLRAAGGPGIITLDSGGLAPTPERGAAVWQALCSGGYDAVAYGPLEASWSDRFWPLVKAHPLPVLDAPSAAPASDWRVESVTLQRAGWTVGLLAIGPAGELAKADSERLQQVLRGLRPHCHLVVLCSRRPLVTDRAALAAEWAGLVDLLVVAPNGELRAPEPVGTGWMVPAAAMGREVGVAAIEWSSALQRPALRRYERRPVTSGVAADPDVAARIQQAEAGEQAAFLGAGVAADEEALVEHGYVPSRQCAPCHAAAYRTWQASRHAQAVRTLVQRQALRPECLPCHSESYRVAGKLLPTGEDETHGVECATCHDGAILHLAIPRVDTITRGDRAACRRCHDPANDPHWDAPRRWRTVQH